MNVEAKEARALPFIIAWFILVVLVGLSIFSAFEKLTIWAPILEFSIAACQALVIFVLFMRLKGHPSLKWVFAGVGFFWLLFLFGFSMTDYATRRGWPPG